MIIRTFSAACGIAIAILVGSGKAASAQDVAATSSAVPPASEVTGLTLDADEDGIIDAIEALVAEQYTPAAEPTRIEPEVRRPPRRDDTGSLLLQSFIDRCGRVAAIPPGQKVRRDARPAPAANDGLCDPLLVTTLDRDFDAPVADVSTAARQAAAQRRSSQ